MAVFAALLATVPGSERRPARAAMARVLVLLGPQVHKLTGVMGVVLLGTWATVLLLRQRLSARLVASAVVVGILAAWVLRRLEHRMNPTGHETVPAGS